MRIVHRVDRSVPSLKKFIFDLHGSSNVSFFNCVPFFVSRSQNIGFGTVEAILNSTPFYALLDSTFNCLNIDLLEMKWTLNDVAEEEHVGDIGTHAYHHGRLLEFHRYW